MHLDMKSANLKNDMNLDSLFYQNRCRRNEVTEMDEK